MNLVLERIESDDDREVGHLAPGETITYRVTLGVDGRSRVFCLFLERARIVRRSDAGLFHGDALLTELLRFQPEVLRSLYEAVGRHRRGTLGSLPIVLAESSAGELSAPTEATSG